MRLLNSGTGHGDGGIGWIFYYHLWAYVCLYMRQRNMEGYGGSVMSFDISGCVEHMSLNSSIKRSVSYIEMSP